MNYVLAKLNIPSKGLKGDWYVYYSALNPATGEMERFRERKGLNRTKTIRERKFHGAALVDRINGLLKAGWSPFTTASDAQQSATIPLLDLLENLFEIKKGTIRPRTQQHYRHAINIFKEFLELKKLSYISAEGFLPATARSFADFLVTNKKHSGKSHNNQIANFKMFFNMMVDREIIQKNPFKGIKKVTEEKGYHAPYSDAQRKKITEYLEKHNPNLLRMCKFIYYCFIRPNELMQLKVKNIDWTNKRINIPGHISKNRKQSSVEIPDVFFGEVQMFYEKKDPDFYLFGYRLDCNNRPVHRNRASQAHKDALEKLEISKEHTLYSWKHTGAVAAINSGMNPYNLMMQLRHHSLEQTTIYLRALGMTSNTEFSIKQPAF